MTELDVAIRAFHDALKVAGVNGRVTVVVEYDDFLKLRFRLPHIDGEVKLDGVHFQAQALSSAFRLEQVEDELKDIHQRLSGLEVR